MDKVTESTQEVGAIPGSGPLADASIRTAMTCWPGDR
jgi:hypothetical protein